MTGFCIVFVSLSNTFCFTMMSLLVTFSFFFAGGTNKEFSDLGHQAHACRYEEIQV